LARFSSAALIFLNLVYLLSQIYKESLENKLQGTSWNWRPLKFSFKKIINREWVIFTMRSKRVKSKVSWKLNKKPILKFTLKFKPNGVAQLVRPLGEVLKQFHLPQSPGGWQEKTLRILGCEVPLSKFLKKLFFTQAEMPPTLRFVFVIHNHASWPRSRNCGGSRIWTPDCLQSGAAQWTWPLSHHNP
jgi:hypothetical protein